MATVPVTCPAITDFSYNPDQPTYWVEFYSHTMLKNLEAMQAAGFVFDDGELPTAQLTTLWNAQKGKLEEFGKYLSQVQEFYEKMYKEFGKEDMNWLVQITDAAINRIIDFFLPNWLETATGDIDDKLVQGFSRLLAIGLRSIYGEISWMLEKGTNLCPKMKAENDALLGLPMTTRNYNLRQQIFDINMNAVHVLQAHVLILLWRSSNSEIPRIIPLRNGWKTIYRRLSSLLIFLWAIMAKLSRQRRMRLCWLRIGCLTSWNGSLGEIMKKWSRP